MFVFYYHNSTLRIILSIIVGQILVLKKRGIDNVIMCILYYPHLEGKNKIDSNMRNTKEVDLILAYFVNSSDRYHFNF